MNRKDRERLALAGESIGLDFGEKLCVVGDGMRHVFFPSTSTITLRAQAHHHTPLEFAMIGNEGMLGASLVLGIKTAPTESWVQTSGMSCRVPANKFLQHLEESPSLRSLVKAFQFELFVQVTQLAFCSRFHLAESRLARWYLMHLDRTAKADIYLTHQYIADALGLRRSAVSIAAESLQERNLIRCGRGVTFILLRQELEAAACPCYSTLAT